jgi:hypothetical protein
MWREASTAFSGWNWGKKWKGSLRNVGIRAEIRLRNVRNMKQHYQPLHSVVGSILLHFLLDVSALHVKLHAQNLRIDLRLTNLAKRRDGRSEGKCNVRNV